ncbi:MAG: preprotein translocase subunit YajC [Chitinophagales bacterium]
MNPQYFNLVFIGGMLAVMYLFFIRPQSQKIKKEKEFTEGLKKGDKVVTTGGLHGTVVSMDGDIIYVDIAKDVKVKMQRSAISMELSQQAS